MSMDIEIPNSRVIFDFNTQNNISNWRIINDAVMGGMSKGKFSLNENNKGVFEGVVSIENNGGFSFLRHRFQQLNIAEFSKIILYVKGDGKKYQFRMKSNKNEQHSYVTYFQTTNEWQLLEFDLADLKPAFRGKTVNMANYPGEQVEEIGFLIGNKCNEQFKLIIDSITLR